MSPFYLISSLHSISSLLLISFLNETVSESLIWPLAGVADSFIIKLSRSAPPTSWIDRMICNSKQLTFQTFKL